MDEDETETNKVESNSTDEVDDGEADASPFDSIFEPVYINPDYLDW